MAHKLLDGDTSASDYFPIADAEDVIMAVELNGADSVSMDYRPSNTTKDIHVAGSTTPADTVRSFDLLPDNCEVRLVPNNGTADAWLDGSYIS